jgi:DNA polymerase-3 subunit alpha
MPSSKDYVNAAYAHNQNSTKYETVALAITDHGVIHGITDHYNACVNPDAKERAIKPIYGIEIYHSIDRDIEVNRFHLVLLAKNQTGLNNLYEIASDAGMHLFHGKQKDFTISDLKFLATHGEGIIALTGCIGGLVPKCVINGQEQDAKKYLDFFGGVFDDVYLEVQPNDLPEQLLFNDWAVRMAQQSNYKLVMTSDSHYINASDTKYHNILKDINHQTKFTISAHMKTPEEMEVYCHQNGIPVECITNTALIADQCNADPKPVNNRELLPLFPVPAGYTEDSYLRKKAFEGLRGKIIKNKIKDPVKYIKTMLYELSIICNAGYAGYFLILWDWFDWCRQNKILTGPGRGSAAGSIVSYVLNITKVDPIKNGFFFERFLNPGRLSFPDIDTDIPRSKRAEAIAYLQQRYGVDKVAQIITFGEYKLKNTVKAIMSSLGCNFQEANEITKGIPDAIDGKTVSYELIEGVATDPDNEKYVNFSDQEKKQLKSIYDKFQDLFVKYPVVYDGVKSICGCIASTGIHAGGVIVCREPIHKHMGIMEPTGAAVLPIIQISMNDLEFYGFLKIDALGLSTLDVLQEAMDLTGLDYDWYDSEDYSDPKVFEMLRNGETTDVFQMSAYNPTRMISDFKVEDIEGLTAVNAGNRPGPLEKDKVTGKSMVDLYAERRAVNSVPSIDPRIDYILAPTMGCIYYQEQCMALGRIMAGYDLGGADTRIRAVLGKKKLKQIPEIRNEFIYGKASIFNDKHEVIGMSEEPSKYCTGALAHGFTLEVATKIFDIMEAFAKYSFNKAHAFCYAVVSYKTAYLSCYYPVEFAIANCTVNEEEEKIIATLSLAKKRKIPVLGPDINKSKVGFSYEMQGVQECIRYGLKAIKGVGKTVLDFINKYKNFTNRTFVDLDEYYNNIHANDSIITGLIDGIRLQTGKNSTNPMKKDVETALILSGAFDYCEPNRYKLLNHYLVDIKREKEVSLFDTKFTLPLDEKSYVRKEKLKLEKEFMGAYISEHPLDNFPYEDFDSATENQEIQTSGIVTKAVIKQTKKGKPYLTLSVKDKNDIERNVNVFDEDLAQSLKNDVRTNSIVIVKGKVSRTYNNVNASSVKIAIAKKQVVDTEDIVVEERITPVPSIIPVKNDPLSDMFGLGV